MRVGEPLFHMSSRAKATGPDCGYRHEHIHPTLRSSSSAGGGAGDDVGRTSDRRARTMETASAHEDGVSSTSCGCAVRGHYCMVIVHTGRWAHAVRACGHSFEHMALVSAPKEERARAAPNMKNGNGHAAHKCMCL
jgi:hypothetical protein